MHGFDSCWQAVKLFPLVTTLTGGSRGIGLWQKTTVLAVVGKP